MRLLAKVIFPLVAFLAPLVFVLFALFAAFRLDFANSNAFSYAVIIYSIVISSVFVVLAYFSRKALTQTQFTFVRVFSTGIAEADPALRKRLREEPDQPLEQPQTVADSVKRGLREYYESHTKRLKEPQRAENFLFRAYGSMSKHFFSPIYAVVSRRFFFPVYAFATLVIISSGFTSFTIQKSYLLQNSLLDQISTVGVLLFVFSYLTILSVWHRTLYGLHEPSIWGSEAFLSYVDYVHVTFPIRVPAGDSRQVLLHFLRDTYKCTFPDKEYLEAEIQAAGVDIDSEKKLRLPDCFLTQKILWSCLFAKPGKHTVTLSLNKVDSTKSTKDIIYARKFCTEVVSPFRASLQVALPLVISATSALTALLTALHVQL